MGMDAVSVQHGLMLRATLKTRTVPTKLKMVRAKLMVLRAKLEMLTLPSRLDPSYSWHLLLATGGDYTLSPMLSNSAAERHVVVRLRVKRRVAYLPRFAEFKSCKNVDFVQMYVGLL